MPTPRSKVAVVTGAGRGLGQAIARALHGAGHRVVLGDLREPLAHEAARALGSGALAYPLDVTREASVRALIAHVERELGPIDVWVNNAGVMPSGAFAAQEPASMDATIDVNFRGMVLGTRLVLPGMLARGRGHVISIASATAAHPVAGLAVYSGTKAAVVAFTRALRRELRGTGVRISAVLPYLAQTAMGAGIRAQPGFRAVTPEQVASSVLRVLRTSALVQFVPGPLRFGSALINALPLSVRDWLDDLLGTDAIGLGGDAAARRAYHEDAQRR